MREQVVKSKEGFGFGSGMHSKGPTPHNYCTHTCLTNLKILMHA